MPATLSYPGVYFEELPSGVRTITGVATSISAFLGRAVKGPTDDYPQGVQHWAFTR
jgi:phage tail sheath protein FI